jgi:hypothetical protein
LGSNCHFAIIVYRPPGNSKWRDFIKNEKSDKTGWTKTEQKFYYFGMDENNGFQKGNQFARKHGFYPKVLDPLELMEYEEATQRQGLDEEIALLRVKIKSLAERDPENIKLLSQAINMLVKLVVAKYHISKDDKDSITRNVGNALRNIAIPAGLAVAEMIEKFRG